MQFELDTHTHTIASAHAYSTIEEMAQAAAGKGLKLLAITDDAPSLPDSSREASLYGISCAAKGTVWCTDDVWRGVKYHGF